MEAIILKSARVILVIGLLTFLVNCEKFNNDDPPVPEAPSLIVTGDFTDDNISAYTKDTVVFYWEANKGTSSLVDFSIMVDGDYLNNWENKPINKTSSTTYKDSLKLIMPESVGEYTVNFCVNDSIGLSADKSFFLNVEKPPLPNNFVYFENSTFLFVVKYGSSDISIMEWLVSAYDSSTGIATISESKETEETPRIFYLKNSENGALEYSSDGIEWKNLTDPSGELNFLYAAKALSPSGLGGLVFNSIENKQVSYPEGTSPGVVVSSEYDASSYDSYYYSNSNVEYYCEAAGFIKSVRQISDFKYFPVFSFNREIELINYKIYLPDGSIREGGTDVPAAPSDLTAYYGSESYIDYSTLTWRTKYFVKLTWSDNSDNETHFDIYMKIGDGEFRRLSDITDQPISPDVFSEGATKGEIEWGNGAAWGTGTYTFKLKAVAAVIESEFSNEATMTVN